MKKPRLISFLYHDIVPAYRADRAANSRPGPYSIGSASFEKHVSALAATGKTSVLINNIATGAIASYAFTFDDGYQSALQIAAPILEKHGLHGHFFIITANIGKPGYLNENEIRELHKRGHCIGSHSHSHNPLKNNAPSEWLKSVEILSGILKEKITVASVPGGWYSKAVAKAAANAGIEWLFNSAPTVNIQRVENCNIAGRFSVRYNTTENQILNIVNNKFPAREKQWLSWNIKKGAKLMGMKRYLKMRKWYFAENGGNVAS